MRGTVQYLTTYNVHLTRNNIVNGSCLLNYVQRTRRQKCTARHEILTRRSQSCYVTIIIMAYSPTQTRCFPVVGPFLLFATIFSHGSLRFFPFARSPYHTHTYVRTTDSPSRVLLSSKQDMYLPSHVPPVQSPLDG